MSSELVNKDNLCFTKYDKSRLKIIDIGANLSDHMYKGFYNHSNKPIHQNDLNNVLDRAFANHIEKIIITGTTLEDSKEVLELASKNDNLFITVGCHPTRCNEFVTNPENYFDGLLKLIKENDSKVLAIGELGLDYDRLHFCNKETQKKYFEKQLELAKITCKPLFFHCRNAYSDFREIIAPHHEQLHGGVVHSFTGSKEEAKMFTDLGYFIGINGCSLKTQENLDAMASIPSEFLMIETDCPWCDIKATHAGFKEIKTRLPSVKKEKWTDDILIKGRNEPAAIIQVLEILSAVRNEDIYKLSETIYENTKKLFKL
jgi:TatD DNase family protein